MRIYYYARTSVTEETTNTEGGPDLISEAQACRAPHFPTASVEIITDRSTDWCTHFADRDGACELLSRMQEGDTVYTSTLTRMFSSIADLESCLPLFREKDVNLYVHELNTVLTEQGLQLSFRRILKHFTELEKHRSSEKVRTIKMQQRSKGRYLGGSRPFGYMVHSNGRLIENPMEQRVLKKILLMKEEGKSLRKISEEVSTPVMPISFKTVQRIIKRHQSR